MVAPAVGVSVEALTAASALLVAGLAGAFSLTGLLITKEQKVSEFRQAWIDALRADIAIYIARVSILLARIELIESLDAVQYLKDGHDDHLELNQAAMRIKLRVNSQESESKTILQSMREIEKAMNADLADIKAAAERIKAASNRLEQGAPLLLKTEWRRVKQGEPIYRVAKCFAAVIFVAAGVVVWIFIGVWK